MARYEPKFDSKFDPGRLTSRGYQDLAKQTDHLDTIIEPLDLPIFGLMGETGGLLNVIKKRHRDDLDTKSFLGPMAEELGDLLWYCAIICQRSGLSFDHILRCAAGVAPASSKPLRLADADERFERRRRASREQLFKRLLDVAGAASAVTSRYVALRRTHGGDSNIEDQLSHLVRSMLEAAAAMRLRLSVVAAENLTKISDRWPRRDEPHPRLVEDIKGIKWDAHERFPRTISIKIFERKVGKKKFVFQKIGDVNIGDPLTDNIHDQDNYRFHDVFHYAYASVIGWSPVTRALLKIKRKSKPKIDENEDGARAVLVEEGVAALVFGRAKGQKFFENMAKGKLSYDLLKTVRDFTAGYEVENTPLWVWEDAILQGFDAFRFLAKERKGWLTADLEKRKLSVRALT